MNEIVNPPQPGEWGDTSDPDIYDAYEFFCGKTNDQVQDFFKDNVIMRCSNLRWMPDNIFQYYILGLKQFLDKNKHDVDVNSDAASEFVRLVVERINKSPESICVVFSDLSPVLADIALNQEEYGLDRDIYGDFHEKVQVIFNQIRPCAG